MSDFSVTVGSPELVGPETPTPHQFNYLSNIDDQMGLRNHFPFIHVYPGPPNAPARDPGPILRQALSRALTHYYLLAGRLRECDQGKLVLECTGEGVVYREADADATIGRLREANGGIHPPFRRLDRFLVDDVWGCNSVTNSPLLRVQVTRLSCGGFVLAYTVNHCACDAFGAHQFVTAVAELSRKPALLAPSVLPQWSRDILAPRSPPKVSYKHSEYDELGGGAPLPSTEADFRRLSQTSAFFSRADVASLKRQIDGGCTTFDAVASCLWRARSRALGLGGSARLVFTVDTRSRHRPVLPRAYYGSAIVAPSATADAGDLIARPLKYAAGLISAAKAAAAVDEYRASTVDFIEVYGRRGFCTGVGVLTVTDVSRLRFADVDFGWGPAAYGGIARVGTGWFPGLVMAVVGYRRAGDGMDGLLALASLPPYAVDAFHDAVRKTVADGFAPVSEGRSSL